MALGVECWGFCARSGARGSPVTEGWEKEEARPAAEVIFGEYVSTVVGDCWGEWAANLVVEASVQATQ